MSEGGTVVGRREGGDNSLPLLSNPCVISCPMITPSPPYTEYLLCR